VKILTLLVAAAAAAFISNFKLTVGADDHLVGEDLIGCYELSGRADGVIDPFQNLICKTKRDFRFDSAGCLMKAIAFKSRSAPRHVEETAVLAEAEASDAE
jgi:hypothetical protein